MEKKSRIGIEVSPAEKEEANIILRTLTRLVEPLQATLPGPSEVVLHDLSRLPNSIVNIAGDITGRTIGGCATNTLLRDAANNILESNFNYLTKAANGADVCCSTLVFRTSTGTPVAAMCTIRDISVWETFRNAIDTLIPSLPREKAPTFDDAETFSKDVDELAQDLLDRTIESTEIPVEFMQKKHKVAVVAELQQRGFFLLREAAEKAADALEVSRFTIYNYLKEINASTPDSEGTASK
ncbi:helix-turn-helix transcriptional regulator [Actinotignum sp. GS-2025c]|uniref:helix-turn-helix transcriptional regulator n=1 Tax=Actinotignum sp. GS-2025c TaxID=3427276 RepID=UPI003F471CA5